MNIFPQNSKNIFMIFISECSTIITNPKYLLFSPYSFDKPIMINNKFIGFEGWNMVNDKFRSLNVSYIVRIEFRRHGFKENRLKRHFKRYWLPGALWVERSVRKQNILARYVNMKCNF